MLLFIPFHVDVPMRRVPWMNWVLIGVTIVFYPLCISGSGKTALGEFLTAGGPSVLGLAGDVLVHGGLGHLLGNMFFLWIFGNAVCSKVGNFAYPIIYFGIAFVEGVLTFAIDPRPAIGASGAINGIVAMFVVFYFLNDISCWYCNIFAGAGVFSISSIWMILLWLVFDIIGLLQGSGGTSYLSHLFGFAAGFTLAVVLLKTSFVKMERGERSLLQFLSGETEEEERPQRRMSVKRRVRSASDDR
jgi:membrane associated rhomboid family serine protease